MDLLVVLLTAKIGLLLFSFSAFIILLKLLVLSCFVVTSKFVNTPNLVYKVSRTFPDFLKLRDELERILPGNFTNNEYSIPIQATVLEAFLRKAATFVEIKTSIQFASFLSSINLIAFSSSVSSKSLKSISNSYGDNLDISNVCSNHSTYCLIYVT